MGTMRRILFVMLPVFVYRCSEGTAGSQVNLTSSAVPRGAVVGGALGIASAGGKSSSKTGSVNSAWITHTICRAINPPERDVTALDEVFRDREQQCRAVAQQLGDLDPAVLAVALVGSCARGALTPDDRDFLVLVDSPGHINRMEHMARQLLGGSDTRYSFIFYTRDNLDTLLSRQSPSTQLVHFARFLTRLLRHLPGVKRFLVWLLGPRKTLLQIREVLPQSFQTAIPLYDPDSVLTDLQADQAAKLQHRLQPLEREFYSPYGFHKLLQGYLSGRVDSAAVQSILRACDIDARDYVERLAVHYESLCDERRAVRCRAIFSGPVARVRDCDSR
jgi:hypothetical protein